MIELINICKSFNNKNVLNGINVRIEKGETFVIIGQSGTGKTVTLKNISGLVEPDSGDVIIDGIKMNGANQRVKDKLRKKMGIVFQAGALINWMSVVDNISLPLREHKTYPPDKINRIVNEKLDMLQLNDARDKMPDEISGGMKKRASLARVLVTNPEIILYDEPTSGLDPVMSVRISEMIKQTQKNFDVTSVVVTHDMNSAYHIADRIAMLYRGKVIQCGTPDEINKSANPVVQQFINGSLEGPIEI